MPEQLLVSTQWLHDHLTDPDLRIVDIRGHVIPATEPLPNYFNHRADYDKSHIPGAVFVDWIHEITDPDDPRHAKVAKPDRYAAVMSRLGIGSDTQVIAYDDARGMFAARLWWTLNYFGHTAVAVLDGGWTKWIAEDRPVNADIPIITPTQFIAQPNPALYRTGDQVLAAIDNGARLLDARSRDEFEGKWSRAKRSGHIPGAINRPRTDFVAPDDTMLPPEKLREKFAASGVDESASEIIVYCNAGVSASYDLLATRVAGLQNGVLYDGSWKDWGNDESKPIEPTKGKDFTV